MSERHWTATAERLPNDGQSVLVKTAQGTVEHRVTFRAAPAPRWETASLVAEFDLYPYWRELPQERRASAREARPSA